MGKISTKDQKDQQRHTPLYKDIAEVQGLLPSSKGNKKSKRKSHKRVDDEDDQNSLDAASSRRVLQLAKEQQDEVERENDMQEEASRPRFQIIHESDEEEEEENAEEEYGEEEYYELEEDEDLDDKDVALFEAFFKGKHSNNAPFQSINLADKIMEKLNEKNLGNQNMEGEESQDQNASIRPEQGVMLPPRVIEAYERVGDSLRAWTHGKLPKLFKVLPTIRNWEDLIYVTQPESWTPNAVYEATRLFISNLNATKAERFVNLVLYPRFRMDIEQSEGHKLNYHLFRALKKALYKPQAFFKGFLFPLIEENCSLREAMISASVLTKTSIPVQHASVALSWLLEQEYTPASTVFIRVLVEKKYALPYQTIDDLVFYFMRFRVITDKSSADNDLAMDDVDDLDHSYKRKINQAPELPIVWHKAFLSFAQRYKNDITDDQRDFLMETLRQRGHKQIASEIRRELLAGKTKQLEDQKMHIEKQPLTSNFSSDVMSYF